MAYTIIHNKRRGRKNDSILQILWFTFGVSIMFGRWIHKDGKSRPDKRFKNVKSQAKTNGAKKRKKKK